MDNQYDFYSMGIRYAKEGLVDLRKKAESIGKEYGRDARIEFEVGISSMIPVYSSLRDVEISEKQARNATVNFGKDNMMNKSYFDSTGVKRR